jgi:translation initiation factor IF-3
VPLVRLLDSEGNTLGERVPFRDALQQARDAGLDLVEIAPTANPPVAKIMDYNKFSYEESKQRKEQKKKQKQIKVKEVKFRPGTDKADYEVKLRNLRSFIEEGNKVKVTVFFRGREIAHQELGARLLDRVKKDTEEYAKVEFFPNLEGRQLVMVLAPKKKQ